MKIKKVLGAVIVMVALCTALVLTQQCFSKTMGDTYADSMFRAAMTNDPSGKNTLTSQLPHWLAEKWAGDDAPYQKAREEVDNSTTSPKVYEALYQLQASRQPHSAVAQFRWAYSLRKRIDFEQPSSQRTGTISALFYALTEADNPDTYNYSRLRYIVSPASKETTQIGERLFKQDPEDTAVKSALAGDYAFSVGEDGSPQSKARALELCHQLLQNDPKQARYYALLSTVYEMSYTHHHNDADAAAAIAASRKYISLVDPQSEYARMEADGIGEIEADLAKDHLAAGH